MTDFVTRDEHDRDILRLEDRIEATERLLHERFTHAIDRLDDHLRAQDRWLLGIFGTLIAWGILHALHIA